MIASAKEWVVSSTVLLITAPGVRQGGGKRAGLVVAGNTMVDVDPEFEDASWLRGYARRELQRESVGAVVPEGIWDVEAACGGVKRLLFSLADADEW